MALPVRQRRAPELTTWNPFADLEQTTRRLSRLLDEMWAPMTFGNGFYDAERFLPPGDLEETDDEYILEVELPGVKKDDIDITLEGRRLTVSGERKERERDGILRRRTRTLGRFFYEVVLPSEPEEDGATANLEDGVLTVKVRKAAHDRKARRTIPIS